MTLRNNISDATSFSPNELVFGKKMTDVVEKVYNYSENNMARYPSEIKKYAIKAQ